MSNKNKEKKEPTLESSVTLEADKTQDKPAADQKKAEPIKEQSLKKETVEVKAPVESKGQKKETTVKKPHKKQQKENSSGPLIPIAILVVAASCAYAGYFLWTELEKSNQTIQSLSSELAQQKNSVESSLQTIQQKTDGVEKKASGLDGKLLEVYNRLGDQSKLAWQMAEAEYLISIANERLSLEGDANTALQALRAADARIRDTKEPFLIKVREKLAQEIQQLDAVEKLDITGMALALQSLISNVSVLPQQQMSLAVPKAQNREEKQQADTWSDVGQMVWADLKGLIVIRQHDKPAKPLLPPDSAFFLKANLTLQLEAAKLALLKREESIFNNNTASAKRWILEYFDNQNNQVKQAVRTLESLEKVQIKPELPDISGSLRLLRDSKTALSSRVGVR